MSKILDGKRITLGTCYYPEQWPESMWAWDMAQMRALGIETIRCGEFAWSRVEKTEGVFDYSFFDRVLDRAEAAGLNVIFGTPTATPPAWLTQKYPEVLNADINGVLYRHGDRRHYNYTSPVYQDKVRRIVTAIAEHYAQRKCIIGWQIDNEINCQLNEFYAESDSAAFRTFLRGKYGTLDALNEAWGTSFWNQDYTDWEEVYVPRPVAHNVPNPHTMLDYKRFVSQAARDFVKMQADILRKYIKSGDFITTNGIFGNLDSHKMTRESLDFLTFDSYPNFAYAITREDGSRAEKWDDKAMNDRHWSKTLARVRSASPVFGIMEQQVGANGWIGGITAPAPRPGQITLWTMQSIAHGADYVSYYRWRTAAFGTEMYWHGILDYASRGGERAKEVQEVHKALEAIAEVAGSKYYAEVGILRDYDNEWDSEVDLWHGAVENASSEALFEALQRTHTPFDYVNIDEDTDLSELTRYKVLFYPHPVIMSEARSKLLRKYAEAGGTLVFGCRSGLKDMRGHCVMTPPPGLLTDLTGVNVTDWTFTAPDTGEVPIVSWLRLNTKWQTNVFADLLEAAGAQGEDRGSGKDGRVIEGKYKRGYLEGKGAVAVHYVGRGVVYYYGTAWNIETAKAWLEYLKVDSPLGRVFSVPDECELCCRQNDKGNMYFFILNYSPKRVEVCLHSPMTNMITGESLPLSEGIGLEPYGVLVVKADKK